MIVTNLYNCDPVDPTQPATLFSLSRVQRYSTAKLLNDDYQKTAGCSWLGRW